MYSGNDFATRWFRVGLAARLARRSGNSARRAIPTKSSRETAGSSSPQEKEDPLAPLLQQANDAIDKMDFAAALDPLQKYIAQRPDEPYPHFQLGYAYVGLKRPDGCEEPNFRARLRSIRRWPRRT